MILIRKFAFVVFIYRYRKMDTLIRNFDFILMKNKLQKLKLYYCEDYCRNHEKIKRYQNVIS